MDGQMAVVVGFFVVTRTTTIIVGNNSLALEFLFCRAIVPEFGPCFGVWTWTSSCHTKMRNIYWSGISRDLVELRIESRVMSRSNTFSLFGICFRSNFPFESRTDFFLSSSSPFVVVFVGFCASFAGFHAFMHWYLWLFIEKCLSVDSVWTRRRTTCGIISRSTARWCTVWWNGTRWTGARDALALSPSPTRLQSKRCDISSRIESIFLVVLWFIYRSTGKIVTHRPQPIFKILVSKCSSRCPEHTRTRF